MSRRGATDLSGILCVDKPIGMTSHDVVGAVRRATGERRVGHAGTLDPMATGVLVVLVGPATRLAPYLTAENKSYAARIVFGSRTDTDDAEGQVVATSDVRPCFTDTAWAAEQVAGLIGQHSQVPPAYSAIKLSGRKAYDMARTGQQVEIEPRTVVVHAAVLDAIVGGPPVAWDVTIDVSKGFYVRSMARDLGESLGTSAHLGSLRRLSSGALSVDDALALDAVTTSEDVSRLFVPAAGILGLPIIVPSSEVAERIATGISIPEDAVDKDAEGPFAVVWDDRLLAIYGRSRGCLRPEAVFPGGIR